MKKLAVFARTPEPGRVKTRLSPAFPAPLAAALHVAMLTDTLDLARGRIADECTVWWDREPAPLEPFGIPARFQQGADLGERLAHAFDALHPTAGARVVVIGSDCPSLAARHLDAAFAALESADVALGPATDGGYWAIGLKRPAAELFRDIAWGGPGVFADTRDRAEKLGLRVAALTPLADLDTPADLAALCGALARGEPACGPIARALLASLGLARP